MAGYNGTSGNDTYIGTPDADTIYGQGGNDSLHGQSGNDSIWGGDGDDSVWGNDGNDVLHGENGNDHMAGNEGNDTIYGGAGNDQAWGNGGVDSMEGGTGKDSLYGGEDDDYIHGGADDDVLAGDSGNDSIWGNDGHDWIDAGEGDDELAGNEGNDTINGNAGNDEAWGNSGNDSMTGGAGNDSLYGGADDDLIQGGDDNDILAGGGENDTLLGGSGSDTLEGGDGNDSLDGGEQADRLTGGEGFDIFVAGHEDRITDFGAATGLILNDGDRTNNDFVDLTGYYNEANLATINATRIANGLRPYASPLGWLRADQADGVLNDISSANGFNSPFTMTIQNNGVGVAPEQLTTDSTGVVCFSSEALIETDRGPVQAGMLRVGDLVRTMDDGLQPIRWISRRELSAADFERAPQFRPVRIRKNALGAGMPAADLVVSPQHRMLVDSKIAQRMFGCREVLAAAKQLVELDGVDIAEDLDSVLLISTQN